MRAATRLFCVIALFALLVLQIQVGASNDDAVKESDADIASNATTLTKNVTLAKNVTVSNSETNSKEHEKEPEKAPDGKKEKDVKEEQAAASASAVADGKEQDAIDDDDDDTIELNPNYVEEESDDEEDEYDEYDSEDEEEEVPRPRPKHKKASKMAINKALAQSRKLPRKTVQFVKKNRVKITIAMTLFAFRREIIRLLFNQIAPPIGKDPITGKIIRQWKVKVTPTNLIKIFVFIDIMRQMQSAGKKNQSPIVVGLLLLATKHPMLGSFITNMILQENNSYIPPVEQHYTFERLNERYSKDCMALQKAADFKKKPQEITLETLTMMHNVHNKPQQKYNETVIVIDLTKLESGRMELLRDEVSFLIHQHRQSAIVPYGSTDKQGHSKAHEVEVLVLLESPGGGAAEFALASQHLLRLRKEPGIQVTVCVDKVAASGGYMIACAATPGRLFAAPFAVVGSIGVIGQIVNVHKTLEGWGMKPMVFRSAKDKSPVNLIGDVSSKDMKSIQKMVDETHVAFKRHVAFSRPRLAETIEKLATGKVWLGYDALQIGLVDRIITSDEYIAERIADGAKLLKLMKNTRKQSLLFGGSGRRADPLRTGLATYLLAPLKEYAQNTLIALAKNANLDVGQGHHDDASISFRAPAGQVLAQADVTCAVSSSTF